MLLDDLVRDRQSQSRTLSHWFRSKEGIKDALKILLRYALAVIGHTDVNRIIRMPRLDMQLALSLHRLCSIGEQIEEHLIEL